MRFDEVLDLMQKGSRAKLPEWRGYWRWDDDEETIIIHNKDGTILDIRDTQDVDFTIRNMCRTDWTTVTSVLQWFDELDFRPEPVYVPLKRGDSGDPVKDLQRDLNKVGNNLTVDGVFGAGTERAVKTFQKRAGLVVDGVFSEKTAATLDGYPFPESLQQIDIEWAANELQCDVASIMAVSEVESRGRGFFGSGRPAVLFERHWMRRRLTHHGIDYKPYMQAQPNIVNTRSGGYKGGEAEHDRIAKARAIHSTSALESASWGAYQIMGFHWERLGYASVDAFVDGMERSERFHLEAFVRFNQKDPVLLKALRNNDFHTYAVRYNGPKQKGYDRKMQAAYNRIRASQKES